MLQSIPPIQFEPVKDYRHFWHWIEDKVLLDLWTLWVYSLWIKLGVTEGYTEEDYQNFKRTALVATTSYATNAKEGCENEFAIFVETDPDLYLPNLSEYITFKKEEEINVIDISDCAEILSAMKDRIKNVEVYYNPYTTKLVSVIEEAKIYNIVTQKEV